MTKETEVVLFNVILHMKSGNSHFVQLTDAHVKWLEDSIEEANGAAMPQVYCQQAASVVGIRVRDVELYEVKETIE